MCAHARTSGATTVRMYSLRLGGSLAPGTSTKHLREGMHKSAHTQDALLCALG